MNRTPRQRSRPQLRGILKTTRATGDRQSELPAAAGHLLTVKLGAQLRSEGTPGPQRGPGQLALGASFLPLFAKPAKTLMDPLPVS